MPEVWYDMELSDFMLMQKGFFEKRKADEIRFAKVAFYVNAIGENLAGKRANGKKFIMEWLGEKSQGLSQDALNERRKVIKAQLALMQKIHDEKKKNGRATQNSN